jgi:hypothetical protein
MPLGITTNMFIKLVEGKFCLTLFNTVQCSGSEILVIF